mmetsp:Transcript_19088/g.43353  ORF Transcript_19088/g.43353 Transcript_19088/m.43353 type:complete len:291 (-) Transcript_19088:82-954(-)
MPGYRKRAVAAALCFLARLHGSGASQGAARQGVTPAFFEEEPIARPFNPSASGPQTIAALQTASEQAGGSHGPPFPAQRQASPAARRAQHSAELVSDAALQGPSAWSAPRFREAAGTAEKIASLFASGARAAAKNVAPSWFQPASMVATDAVPAAISVPAAPAVAAAKAAVAEPAPRSTVATQLESPGAVSFLGNFKRASLQPQKARAASMLQSGDMARGAAAAPAGKDLPVKLPGVPPVTPESQAENLAAMRRLEEQREAEAREAEEINRQASLEDKMTSARLETRGFR